MNNWLTLTEGPGSSSLGCYIVTDALSGFVLRCGLKLTVMTLKQPESVMKLKHSESVMALVIFSGSEGGAGLSFFRKIEP